MNTPDTSWHPAFILALQLKGNVRIACRNANIARSSAYEHYTNAVDAEAAGDTSSPYYGFAQAWDDAIEDYLDRIEEHLSARAEESDTTAAIFILKHRRRHIYGEVQRLEHANADGKAFATNTTVRTAADLELDQWRAAHHDKLTDLLAPPAEDGTPPSANA